MCPLPRGIVSFFYRGPICSTDYRGGTSQVSIAEHGARREKGTLYGLGAGIAYGVRVRAGYLGMGSRAGSMFVLCLVLPRRPEEVWIGLSYQTSMFGRNARTAGSGVRAWVFAR